MATRTAASSRVAVSDWDVQYEADVLPSDATPAWTKTASGTNSEDATDGVLNMTVDSGGSLEYFISPSWDTWNGFSVEARVRINSAGGVVNSYDGVNFNIGAGSSGIDFDIADGVAGLVGGDTYEFDTSNYHIYRLTILRTRANRARVNIYIDGTLRITSIGRVNDSGAGFIYMASGWGGANVADVDVDYVYYSESGISIPRLPAQTRSAASGRTAV